MAGTYTHTTLQNLVDQLAADLNDSGKVFTTSTELQNSLVESLRVWNLLTGFNRSTKSFTTTAGTAFYDLESLFTDELSETVTDQSIVGDMQYRLMESYDPIDSTGISEMFSHADIVRSLQQRRDRFIAESESRVVRYADVTVPAGNGVVDLDDSVIAVVRAVWKDQYGRYFNVRPTDDTVATSQFPSWRQSPAIPRTYSVSTTGNLTLQLIPLPASAGTLELFVVESGPALSTAGSGTALGLPDDLCWGVGWGAMHDLLMRDGIGRDPERAQFCNQLYALCADAARIMPIYLSATMINGRSAHLSTITSLDAMRPGWQGQTTGTPKALAIVGGQMAVQPVPDDIYSISITLVRKTPVPALTDYAQLSREQLMGVLAWAKQLVLFKQGGSQLQQGAAGAVELINQAKIYNEDRLKRSTYLAEIYGKANDTRWTPVREREQGGVGEQTDTASSRGSTRKKLGGR